MIRRRTNELNAVLADWDETKFPSGKIKTFSVGFVSKSGEFRYVKRGIKAGLKMNMKDNDMKAVQPVDENGNAYGHIYPVWIHSILIYSGNIEFNLLT